MWSYKSCPHVLLGGTSSPLCKGSSLISSRPVLPSNAVVLMMTPGYDGHVAQRAQWCFFDRQGGGDGAFYHDGVSSFRGSS